MAKDRKQWKTIKKNRMTHLERWEESQENGWEGGMIERSQRKESVNLGCSQCEKVCKSRAGRAVHIRRMHRENNAEHKCIKCHAKFPTKTNLKNHDKKCRGTTSPTKYVPATKECPLCNKLFSATNLARHMTRSCRKRHGDPNRVNTPEREREREREREISLLFLRLHRSIRRQNYMGR